MQPVVLTWPGGEHLFALPIGQLETLQNTRAAGPEQVYRRLDSGGWLIDDISEVLRLGLIGGAGVPQGEAGPLVMATIGRCAAPVHIDAPGGERAFALPVEQLRSLEATTRKGPEQLLNEIRLGLWRIQDVFEVLRNSMIGGGAEDGDARALMLLLREQGMPPAALRDAAAEILAHTVARQKEPLCKLKIVAQAVLGAGLFGRADDPVGKPEGATAAPPKSGGSRKSTATRRSSASRRKKSAA